MFHVNDCVKVRRVDLQRALTCPRNEAANNPTGAHGRYACFGTHLG
jgi:hypothetical protein